MCRPSFRDAETDKGALIQTPFACDLARADVFDYMERFYNQRRRHSTIGYASLAEFESAAAST